MEIELKGLKIVDIFTALSTAFSNRHKVRHGEYFLDIPKSYGVGEITGIHYPNGVGFICINVTLNEELCLNYVSHQIHPLRFIYSLKNQIIHKFGNEEEKHQIEQYDSAIVASKYPHGDTFIIPKEKETIVTFLDIDRKIFTSQLSEEAHDMKSIFYDMFFDVNGTRTFFHQGLYSLQLAQIIKEISEFEHTDFVRTNFIGAKALEMLSFMLLQYEDDLRDEGMGKVLRKSEIDAVYEVVNYINEHMTNLPSVEELAKKVMLTPAKLQEGFKILHKCTVNEYIMDKRLETAFRLLSETENQINEVVIDIGLSSRSYFSKSFKEKYGVSPSDVKMKKRSKKLMPPL